MKDKDYLTGIKFIVFDDYSAGKTIDEILNHLRYLGYDVDKTEVGKIFSEEGIY